MSQGGDQIMVVLKTVRKNNYRTAVRNLLAGVSVAGLLSACSTGDMKNIFKENTVSTIRSESIKDPNERRKILAQATQYWASEFAKDPTNADAAANYATNLKAQGRDKEAASALAYALRSNPNNQRIASVYGRLALKMGNLRLAEKLLLTADRDEKPDWRVISARGTLHAKKGEHKEARKHFLRAQALAPNNSSILNNIALTYALDKNPQKAEQILRDAIARGHDSKRLRQNLALVLGLQGRFEESKRTAQTALPRDQAHDNTSYLKQLVKVAKNDNPPPSDLPIVQAAGNPAKSTSKVYDGPPIELTSNGQKPRYRQYEGSPQYANSSGGREVPTSDVGLRGTAMPEPVKTLIKPLPLPNSSSPDINSKIR